MRAQQMQPIINVAKAERTYSGRRSCKHMLDHRYICIRKGIQPNNIALSLRLLAACCSGVDRWNGDDGSHGIQCRRHFSTDYMSVQWSFPSHTWKMSVLQFIPILLSFSVQNTKTVLGTSWQVLSVETTLTLWTTLNSSLKVFRLDEVRLPSSFLKQNRPVVLHETLLRSKRSFFPWLALEIFGLPLYFSGNYHSIFRGSIATEIHEQQCNRHISTECSNDKTDPTELIKI